MNEVDGVRRAYIGLGANLGDPRRQVTEALAALAATAGVKMMAVSPLYRSLAIGESNQDDYCNAACAVDTALAPLAILERLLAIERAAGRIRGTRRWGPRLLDLDLLHVDGCKLDEPRLSLPHPRIADRNFVLVPLADIAPHLELPGLGPIDVLVKRIGRAGLMLWD